MHLAVFSETITYILLFLTLYWEVFLLMTFLEKKGQIQKEESMILSDFPAVTVLVPCFNEESTISSTIESLLSLNYPKDKLEILIIDDGSTDQTLSVAKKFEIESNVRVYHKENGGKFTALNFGLDLTRTEFVGCLDADSFVHPDALKNLMPYFTDPKTMAVTPSLKIYNPNSSVIRMIQNVEYNLGIFVRKISSLLNAIYVTPGPFSIFRMQVYRDLGRYHHAHNTEDMEMALRMQSHHYRIVNAHKAVVYTVGPKTLPKLYKQRVRWTHGFLENIKDYRHLILNPKYGNLGLLILPLAFVSFFATLYLVLVSYYGLVRIIIKDVIQIQTVGFHPAWQSLHFSWFFVNTATLSIINVLIAFLTLIIIFAGKRLAGVKDRRVMDLVYSFFLYSFIAPLWLTKAFYNSLFSRRTPWR
ncbi:MAG TPA: glycosyltransferase [Candidatus Paceibacterota bacterium]|nr:glycosyltransferase [Candidatus Paceibacterota bacterium]